MNRFTENMEFEFVDATPFLEDEEEKKQKQVAEQSVNFSVEPAKDSQKTLADMDTSGLESINPELITDDELNPVSTQPKFKFELEDTRAELLPAVPVIEQPKPVVSQPQQPKKPDYSAAYSVTPEQKANIQRVGETAFDWYKARGFTLPESPSAKDKEFIEALFNPNFDPTQKALEMKDEKLRADYFQKRESALPIFADIYKQRGVLTTTEQYRKQKEQEGVKAARSAAVAAAQRAALAKQKSLEPALYAPLIEQLSNPYIRQSLVDSMLLEVEKQTKRPIPPEVRTTITEARKAKAAYQVETDPATLEKRRLRREQGEVIMPKVKSSFGTDDLAETVYNFIWQGAGAKALPQEMVIDVELKPEYTLHGKDSKKVFEGIPVIGKLETLFADLSEYTPYIEALGTLVTKLGLEGKAQQIFIESYSSLDDVMAKFTHSLARREVDAENGTKKVYISPSGEVRADAQGRALPQESYLLDGKLYTSVHITQEEILRAEKAKEAARRGFDSISEYDRHYAQENPEKYFENNVEYYQQKEIREGSLSFYDNLILEANRAMLGIAQLGENIESYLPQEKVRGVITRQATRSVYSLLKGESAGFSPAQVVKAEQVRRIYNKFNRTANQKVEGDINELVKQGLVRQDTVNYISGKVVNYGLQAAPQIMVGAMSGGLSFAAQAAIQGAYAFLQSGNSNPADVAISTLAGAGSYYVGGKVFQKVADRGWIIRQTSANLSEIGTEGVTNFIQDPKRYYENGEVKMKNLVTDSIITLLTDYANPTLAKDLADAKTAYQQGNLIYGKDSWKYDPKLKIYGTAIRSESGKWAAYVENPLTGTKVFTALDEKHPLVAYYQDSDVPTGDVLKLNPEDAGKTKIVPIIGDAQFDALIEASRQREESVAAREAYRAEQLSGKRLEIDNPPKAPETFFEGDVSQTTLRDVKAASRANLPLEARPVAPLEDASGNLILRDTENAESAERILRTEEEAGFEIERRRRLEQAGIKYVPENFKSEAARPVINQKGVDLVRDYVATKQPENAERLDDQSYLSLPDERSVRLIGEYQRNAKHEPDNPEVKKSYEALKTETRDQFRHLTEKSGIKIEVWNKEGQPYQNSADMVKDIEQNKHYFYFPTDAGFGGQAGNAPATNQSGNLADHPMMSDSGLQDSTGRQLQDNDVFRIVHDLYGHYPASFQFGIRGEYNAFNAHRKAYSDAAVPALAAETFMQTAEVANKNYTRAGNTYKMNVAPDAVVYADQKAFVPDSDMLNWITGQADSAKRSELVAGKSAGSVMEDSLTNDALPKLNIKDIGKDRDAQAAAARLLADGKARFDSKGDLVPNDRKFNYPKPAEPKKPAPKTLAESRITEQPKAKAPKTEAKAIVTPTGQTVKVEPDADGLVKIGEGFVPKKILEEQAGSKIDAMPSAVSDRNGDQQIIEEQAANIPTPENPMPDTITFEDEGVVLDMSDPRWSLSSNQAHFVPTEDYGRIYANHKMADIFTRLIDPTQALDASDANYGFALSKSSDFSGVERMVKMIKLYLKNGDSLEGTPYESIAGFESKIRNVVESMRLRTEDDAELRGILNNISDIASINLDAGAKNFDLITVTDKTDFKKFSRIREHEQVHKDESSLTNGGEMFDAATLMGMTDVDDQFQQDFGTLRAAAFNANTVYGSMPPNMFASEILAYGVHGNFEQLIGRQNMNDATREAFYRTYAKMLASVDARFGEKATDVITRYITEESANNVKRQNYQLRRRSNNGIQTNQTRSVAAINQANSGVSFVTPENPAGAGGSGIDAASQGRPLYSREQLDEQISLAQRDLNFLNWFGNSKIVNRDGSPKVMYHGTISANDFSEFDVLRNPSQLGTHVGDLKQSTEFANSRFGFGFQKGLPTYEQYIANTDRPNNLDSKKAYADWVQTNYGAKTNGRIIPVFVKVENPLRLKDEGTWSYSVIEQLRQKGLIDLSTKNRLDEEYDSVQGNREATKNFIKGIQDLIMEKGYDGIVYKNRFEGDKNSDSYIVFESNQLKSIFNVGTFDPANPNILRSREQQPAPVFFSALSNLVNLKMSPKAKAEDLLGLLDPKNGVKKEELEWSGILEWLEDRKGQTVTKAEVQAFLDENKVEIVEVQKGEQKTSNALDNMRRRAQNYLSDESLSPQEMDFFERADAELENFVGDGLQSNEQLPLTLASIAEDIYGDVDDASAIIDGFLTDSAMLADGYEDSTGQVLGKTKYSQWQIEGDKSDYTELLLTLPEKDWRAREKELQSKIYGEGLTEAEHKELIDLRTRERQAPYKSSHWEEPNILAHVRFNSRRDVDGKRVLFIEEIQSDWHQAGRESGYRNQKDIKRVEQIDARIEEIKKENQDIIKKVNSHPDINESYSNFSALAADVRSIQRDIDDGVADKDQINHLNVLKDYYSQYEKLNDEVSKLSYERLNLQQGLNGVPDAPFKKNWQELAFKRMIRHAAENGFDRIAWTTGAMQNERYKLSNFVNRIEWATRNDGRKFVDIVDKDGRYIDGDIVLNNDGTIASTNEQFNLKKLSDVIGVELAEKVQTGDVSGTLKDVDLEVGGSGMKGFYDKILPDFVNRYVKKFNSKVSTTNLGGKSIEGKEATFYMENRRDGETLEDFTKRLQGEQLTVHSVDVTPEMIRTAVEVGQPLFSREQSFGGSGIKRLEMARVTPDGNPFTLTNKFGAEHRARVAAKAPPVFNFFLKKPDGEFFYERGFEPNEWSNKEFRTEGEFNLLDFNEAGTNPEIMDISRLYNDNQKAAMERMMELGYDGFYNSNPNNGNSRYRMSLFDTPANRSKISRDVMVQALMSKAQQQEKFANYKDIVLKPKSEITPADVDTVVKNGRFTVITATKKTDDGVVNRNEELKRDLNRLGLKWIPSTDVFQGDPPEDGFLVMHNLPNAELIIESLGNKYDQMSVLHGINGNYHVPNTTGDRMKTVQGSGVKTDVADAAGYTIVRTESGDYTFTVEGLDWDKAVTRTDIPKIKPKGKKLVSFEYIDAKTQRRLAEEIGVTTPDLIEGFQTGKVVDSRTGETVLDFTKVRKADGTIIGETRTNADGSIEAFDLEGKPLIMLSSGEVMESKKVGKFSNGKLVRKGQKSVSAEMVGDNGLKAEDGFIGTVDADGNVWSAEVVGFSDQAKRRNAEAAMALHQMTVEAIGEPPVKPKKGASPEEIALYNETRSRRAIVDGLALLMKTNYGGDWYAKSLDLMRETLGNDVPEVKGIKQIRALHDILLGLTSRNTEVVQNYQSSIDLIGRFLNEMDAQSLPLTKKDGITKYGMSTRSLEIFSKLMEGFIPDAGSTKQEVKSVKARFGNTEKTTGVNVNSAAAKKATHVKYIKNPELEALIEKHGKLNGVFEYLLQPSADPSIPYRAAEFFGDKVGAFLGNIGGYRQMPTIDIWMMRWFYRLNGDNMVLIKDKKTGEKKLEPKGIASKGETDLQRAIVQEITNRYNDGKPVEEQIQPADVQAVIWYAEKQLWGSIAREAPRVGFDDAANLSVGRVSTLDSAPAADAAAAIQNENSGGELFADYGTPEAAKAFRDFYIENAISPFERIGLMSREQNGRTLVRAERLNKKEARELVNFWNGFTNEQGERFTATLNSTADKDQFEVRVFKEADEINVKPSKQQNFQNPQIDTPEFKKWFGNSKVTDEAGAPLVVYHGTKGDFDVFKARRGDVGIHFGTAGQANDRMDYKFGRQVDEDITGTNVMPVYLKITKPLRLDDLGFWDAENLEYGLEKSSLFGKDELKGAKAYNSATHLKNLKDLIKSKGYDGIVYKNTGETSGGAEMRAKTEEARKAFWKKYNLTNSISPELQKTSDYAAYKKAEDDYNRFREENAEDSYIVLDRTQIKSATGNNGDFDASNPNILRSKQQNFQNPQQQTLDKLKNNDTATWLELAARQVQGGVLAKEEVDEIRRLTAAGDRDALNKYVSGLNKMSIFDLFTKAVRAGMLSGIGTQERNIIGNTAFQALEEISRLPASVVDLIMATATGTDRKVQGVRPLSVMAGVYDAITKGIPDALKIIKEGDPFLAYEDIRVNRETTTGIPALRPVEWLTNMMFRIQGGADKPFRAYAHRRAMDEAIWLRAKRDKTDFATAKASLTPEEYDAALVAAEFAVFQNPNAVSTKWQDWKNNAPPPVKFMMDMAIPFSKTPTNIAARVLDYTGISAIINAAYSPTVRELAKGELKKATAEFEKALNSDEARRTLAFGFGRGMVGWSLGMVGYYLAQAGLLQGFFDEKDKEERNLDEAKRRAAGSIKVGDRWYGIQNFSPVSTLLLAGATYYDSQQKFARKAAAEGKEAKTTDFLVDATTRTLANMAEIVPHFASAMELTGQLSGQRHFNATKAASSAIGAGKLVPAAVNDVAKALDDRRRVADAPDLLGQIGADIQARVPSNPYTPDRNELPERVDMLGDVFEQPRFYDPFNSQSEKNNPVVNELDRLRVDWTMKADKEETKGDYFKRRGETGKRLKEVIEGVIFNPNYVATDDASKKKALEAVIAYVRREDKADRLSPDEEKHNIGIITLRESLKPQLMKVAQGFSDVKEADREKYVNSIVAKTMYGGNKKPEKVKEQFAEFVRNPVKYMSDVYSQRKEKKDNK